jgi:hypothetical protein
VTHNFAQHFVTFDFVTAAAEDNRCFFLHRLIDSSIAPAAVSVIDSEHL